MKINMKPKHNELKQNSFNNKTLDFANLYKSAAETNVKLLETDSIVEYKKKKKKSNDTSSIVIKGSKNLNRGKNSDNSHENKTTGFKDSETLTTRIKKGKNIVTINNSDKNSDDLQENQVRIDELKSSPSVKKRVKKGVINKVTHIPIDDVNSTHNSMNLPAIERNFKPKKRNKSVSFVSDDNEVAVKKTKSNIQSNDVVRPNETLIKPKKPKKKTKLKKECLKNPQDDVSNAKIDNEVDSAEKEENNHKADSETKTDFETGKSIMNKTSKRKLKKSIDNNEIASGGENVEVEKPYHQRNKSKQSKKMKHHSQLHEDYDKADGEPVIKSRKKNNKPEVIVEDLENLNIGDNTHTLTNLLDEMSVVDKKKKLKNKSKKKQGKQPNVEDTKTEFETSLQKEKWNKRKWNKDKKGEHDQNNGITPVTVENLPIRIIMNYKKLLTEHFSKCGEVRRIGIAEVYPSVDPKPVFTTTVYFESGDGAKKAFEEDNTGFEGNIIRVKEYLPPTQTIAVVHSYGELNDQIISSVFGEAGRIRRIRLLVKGKKSKGTAFVEFDGPEAVERAVKVAEETKVGGKNIHVSKYQLKPKKDKKRKEKNVRKIDNEIESDGSDD